MHEGMVGRDTDIYIYTDTEMLKTTGFVVPSSCQGNAVRASE